MYQWDDVNIGADFDVDEGYDYDAYVQTLPMNDYPDAPGMMTHAYKNSGKVWFSAVTLNRLWDWDDTSCEVDISNETADVRVVSTHEFGHLIVLNHDPNETDTVMWPDGTCKLATIEDDHLGVISLYGTR